MDSCDWTSVSLGVEGEYVISEEMKALFDKCDCPISIRLVREPCNVFDPYESLVLEDCWIEEEDGEFFVRFKEEDMARVGLWFGRWDMKDEGAIGG